MIPIPEFDKVVQIRIRETDDWIDIKLGDKLIWENHRCDAIDLLDALNVDYEYRYIECEDEDVFEDQWNRRWE